VTRVRWTTGAADQVEGIIKRIQEGNPAAARKVAQTLLDSIAHLEAFPHLGRPGQEVEGTRELVCPP
jgi:plasmid stabilization system protein ParE